MHLNWPEHRVLVTGGAGFLGRQVCRELLACGVQIGNLLVPRRRQYDLVRQDATARLFRDARPSVVLHLAAQVGGIGANQQQPGRYFYSNMLMGCNVIEQARLSGVVRFLHVASVCSYPGDTPVPFREQDLWQGYPETTNAPYGVAKKSLCVMLDAYKRQYGMDSAVVVPVNLYGPGDNFDLHSSHVVPALIRRCLEARWQNHNTITLWGSGDASRELLYVQDAAKGIVRAAQRIVTPDPINLGTGHEIRIRDLAVLIARLSGYQGRFHWDVSRPDGQLRRCLDVSRAHDLLDWRATTLLSDGLARTINWYAASQNA